MTCFSPFITIVFTCDYYSIFLSYESELLKKRECPLKEQDLHSGQKIISIANQESCTLDKNKNNS